MNIHEYQAKNLLRKSNVSVPNGKMVSDIREVEQVAKELGGPVWVVKAQIHAGGRGKGGGVRICHSVEAVVEAAAAMIGMQLVTPQTGSDGKTVRKIYIEDGCEIERELYVAVLLDRNNARVSLIGSSEGGMNIEEVAEHSPEKVSRIAVDPMIGLKPFHARNLLMTLGIEGQTLDAGIEFITGLYDLYTSTDASLVEINPAVVTRDERIVALDAKINFDDNALFRHPEILALRDVDEEDERERMAEDQGLNYIKLNGNIGCMVNGAGLAMATMDIIELFGASPANFLDVGGGATGDRVKAAFKIILADPAVEGVLVNIFGGIMRCDIIAEGIVGAAEEVGLEIPLVVRLEGTNVELGNKILGRSGLKVTTAGDLSDAAKKIVSAVKR
ncbi:MAG: ADP-forming succinate--CoA ligase subunit beta [Rhodospirillaceae bacterium]|nr:ADP-forming succinate--CoA ligase subunit beta [Rhodospirillaceae bacterium]|tara:strand:+ start:2935 stop:4098 length:1164 start_codon:yes stop_codon:yes gene_type:complete